MNNDRIGDKVWYYGDDAWWKGYVRAWILSPVDDGQALIETAGNGDHNDGYLIQVSIGNLRFLNSDPNVK